MKTERRHELQTNELADWLGQHLEQVRPYGNIVLLGVVAVLAIGGAIVYMSSQQTKRLGEGWQKYWSAAQENDAKLLDDIAQRYAGTTPGLWAKLSAGEFELSRGTRLLFSQRKEGEEALANAKSSFKAVHQNAQGQPDLLARADLGLAQAHEALAELDDAKKHYEAAARSVADPTLARLASQRLNLLRDRGNDFYAWFKDQKPTLKPSPEATGMPRDPSLPMDLGSLPDRPTLDFLGRDDAAKPDAAPKAEPVKNDGEKKPENPEPEKKDADGKDADKKDADKKDAGAEKPADGEKK